MSHPGRLLNDSGAPAWPRSGGIMRCVGCVRDVPSGAFFCPRCGARAQFMPWVAAALALMARVSAEVRLRSEEQKRRIEAERSRSRERRKRFQRSVHRGAAAGERVANPLVDKTESNPVPWPRRLRKPAVAELGDDR